MDSFPRMSVILCTRRCLNCLFAVSDLDSSDTDDETPAPSIADPTESPELLNMTPDPPDDASSTAASAQSPMPHMGLFRMDPVTPQQCLALNTENCLISPASRNCSAGNGFIATCSADASNIEVEYFFTKLQRLNAGRALEVTVRGVREFVNRTFAPVADILIILIVADYPDFALSSLRALELPVITHIQLSNCANLVVKQDDLLYFPRLTMFILAKSTVRQIEEGAFDSLKGLQQVSFDSG